MPKGILAMHASRRAARPLVVLGTVAALGAAFLAGTAIAGPEPDADRTVAAGLEPRAGDPGFGGFANGDLVAAGSCDELLDWYVERGVDLVGPYGWQGPVLYQAQDGTTGTDCGQVPLPEELAGTRSAMPAAPAAPATTQRATSSETGTNVQEAGVDEPDTVKTDGTLLVRLQDGTLTTYDVGGREVERLAGLDLPELADGALLLADETVVVVGRDTAGPRLDDAGVERVDARMVVVDVSDPEAPAITADFAYDSSLVGARQHGDTIRLLLESGLPDLDFTEPNGWRSERSALERNREVVRDSTLEDWLPQVTIDDSTEPLLGCGDVALPVHEAGLGTVTTVGFDAGDPATWSATGLAVDTDLAYVSPDHLYLATTAYSWTCCWGEPAPESQTLDDAGTSHLYEFALEDTATTYLASGQVDGRIADRWAMDEYDGVLRVAVAPTERTGNFNSIVTLERDGSDLVELGRVDKLGVNEQIESVRWFDGLAILVTFRQVDPLYTVDLTDPADPVLLGVLKIPGFSEYLHPLGAQRLIGVGQGPGERGRWGAQVGLFNVSDLTSPRRIDTVEYAGGSSALAATDPRQFTWLPERRTVLTVVTRGNIGRTGSVSVLTLDHGTMTNRMVEVEYGTEVDQVRLVPLPDGRVVLTTGDGVSFFDLRDPVR